MKHNSQIHVQMLERHSEIQLCSFSFLLQLRKRLKDTIWGWKTGILVNTVVVARPDVSFDSGSPTRLLVFMLQVEWVQLEGTNDVHSLLHPVEQWQQTADSQRKSWLVAAACRAAWCTDNSSLVTWPTVLQQCHWRWPSMQKHLVGWYHWDLKWFWWNT